MKTMLRYSSIALLCSGAAFASTPETTIQLKPQAETEQASTQAVPLITSAMVAKWIIGSAKSAITGQVKSFLGGLLFGGSNDSGPQIVRIHHDDLQAIANLVSQSILTSDVHDAKSQLDSFATVMEYYRDSVRGGNTDYAILPVLLNYTTSLSNHRAYKPEYNPTSYALTSSYALVSSFTIAVLTERHLQGFISLGLVKDQAQQLKLKLTALGNETNKYAYGQGRVIYRGSSCFGNLNQQVSSADLPVERPEYNQLLDNDSHVSPMAPAGCLVTASYPGVASVTFDAETLGFWEADEKAYAWLWEQRELRAKQIKGETYDEVINLLASF
jgi:hypothetical protein